MTSLCSNNIKESLCNTPKIGSQRNVFPGALLHNTIAQCEIDHVGGGKLLDKNADESWEITKNLALYDHEGWNDSKEFVKPVKVISTSQITLKTPDRRLLELEDQINFLLKGSRPTPKPNLTHVPQAYVEAVSSKPHPRNQSEPPKQNPFTFHERTSPYPHPQALGTTFEARVRDYMAAHTERMESRGRKSVVNNGAIDESIVDPSKSIEEKHLKEIDEMNEVDEKLAKRVRENVSKNEEE
ncbi:hypothetical protein Tco_0513239 [Tanacetum coccineum]